MSFSLAENLSIVKNLQNYNLIAETLTSELNDPIRFVCRPISLKTPQRTMISST